MVVKKPENVEPDLDVPCFLPTVDRPDIEENVS
jgi:hypothetical protein